MTTHNLLWAHNTKLDLLDLLDRRRGVRKCDRHGGVLSFCVPIALLFPTFTPILSFLIFGFLSLTVLQQEAGYLFRLQGLRCRTDELQDGYDEYRMESESESGLRVFEAGGRDLWPCLRMSGFP